jgi:tetratricopeptide (TPR) repeat protein
MNPPLGIKGRRSERHAVEILYATGFRLHAQERYRDAAQVFQVMLQAAPTDERGWLALADCHEKLGQRYIALELFSAGTVAATPAPRCMLSRFRLLYDFDRSEEADDAYEAALQLAAAADDEELTKLVQNERRVRP